GYGDSPRGKKIIDAFRTWSESNAPNPQFVEGQEAGPVVRFMREIPKDKKVTPAEWQRLLTGVDTDLVLLGEVRKVQYNDPKTIGMYKGTIEGDYLLINAQTGKVAYASAKFSCEYPKLTELDTPMPEFGSNPDDIERGLIREFGSRIGKDLYG